MQAGWRRVGFGIWLGLVVLAAFARVAAAAGPTVTITDSAGRSVEVPRTLAHILPAGPPAAVLLYTLVPDKMLGWTGPLAAAAKEMLPAKYAALPVVGRITGARNAPSAEAITALHPDLILDVGNVDARYSALADRVQKETGVPYLLIDGALLKSAESYRALGHALGEESRAAALAEASERLLAEARWIMGGRKPRVYYARSDGGTRSAAPGSITGEIIDAVGAVNVLQRGEGGARDPVTPAEVAAWNPDAVIASAPEVYAAISHDAAWQQVAAVAAHRLYLAPQAPFCWIDEPVGVNRLIGLPWLAGVLTQGAPPSDMKPLAADFFARFFQVTLTPEALDRLLTAP